MELEESRVLIMDTPVLYIIFNRIDTVRKSIESIRNAKPTKLYIAADGPRNEKDGEFEKCVGVRQYVLSHIDWDCDVHQRFQSTNVGCGHHPADAITWFFENEDSGIILEDDCVASPSFFIFAHEMLKRYKDDPDISIICGSNFDFAHKFQAESADYFFSNISYTWGWATWKRNWVDYDYTMRGWNKTNKQRLLKWLFDEPEYREYWRYIFDSTYNQQPQDIWDYQFFFSCYNKRQMSVVPNVNLISNIGDGIDATHTTDSDEKLRMMTHDLTFPLRHPQKKQRNKPYDDCVQETCYGRVAVIPTYVKIKRYIKRILNINR